MTRARGNAPGGSRGPLSSRWKIYRRLLSLEKEARQTHPFLSSIIGFLGVTMRLGQVAREDRAEEGFQIIFRALYPLLKRAKGFFIARNMSWKNDNRRN